MVYISSITLVAGERRIVLIFFSMVEEKFELLYERAFRMKDPMVFLANNHQG